ncbi:MAG TPA: hypothetical protein VN718_08950 [Rhizomicrobium sp.]|nr:hypothetical protein [Rhizomicrobium sp.]
MSEDDHGMELPTLAAALEEGTRIVQDLLKDPETKDLQGGVVHIVGSDGRSFLSLPILHPPKTARRLH